MTGRVLAQELDKFDQAGCPEARTLIALLLNMDDRDRLLLRAQTEAAVGNEPERVRCVWTAWCVTTGTMPGTIEYEDALTELISGYPGQALDRDYMTCYVRGAFGLPTQA